MATEPSAQADYELLAPAPASLAWRLAVVGSASAGCLLNAGLVFGYSAIFPELTANGAFSDLCGPAPAAPSAHLCAAQARALTGMFTLATSALNIVGVLAGVVLDQCGPRATGAGAAGLVAVGCLLFAAGGDAGYRTGFLLMGVSGPSVFVSSMSFVNLFPGKEGLCTAALVGCFDASSAVFAGLAWSIEGGVGLGQAFAFYALVPTLIAAMALLLWPAEPVPKPARKEVEEEEEQTTALSRLPLRQQALSVEYILLVHAFSVGMLSINFFIATCDLQLLHVNAATAQRLGVAFSAMLPLGGVVYIPAVGLVVDRLGAGAGFLVFWAALLAFGLLNAAYAAAGMEASAYSSFTIFAFCRPLFYTLGAAFVGQFFGFANFGLLYGMLCTLAGVCNCLVQPLEALAQSRGFALVNAGLVGAQLTTVALPALMWCRHERSRRREERQLSEELRFVNARLSGASQDRKLSDELRSVSRSVSARLSASSQDRRLSDELRSLSHSVSERLSGASQ